jgi:transcriptional regulator with GAF, ATPase, and Fis domain
MNPRLAALAGPLRPSVLPLAGERISIGRSRVNQVCLGSRSVSREHCFIERQADRFGITDLDSLNGTFVNGVPVKKRTLEHGDQVRIGDCVFVFLMRDPEPQEAPPSVELTDIGAEHGTTVELPVEDPGAPEATPPSPRPDRLQRDFDALLRFSAEVHSVRRSEVLLRQVLGSLLDVIPARRGALLLAGGDGGSAVPVAALDRSPGKPGAVPVNRAITRRVLRERIAILSNDAGEDGPPPPSESGASVRSVIAVPLLSGRRTLGVIYLDSGDPAVRFDEDHLKLLTAMANVTAVALENARLFDSLHDQNQRLRVESKQGHEMIGESSAMQRVREFVTRVAPSDTTVLITGESGTGKEVLAREIVAGGPRAGKPLEAINCAALAESLLESELFGHERGAFTGAVVQKKGKLEVADGGTVFLDEVGELAAPLQAKLLRALQSREFTRLGGTRPVTVDIRVLAATNKDLAEAVRARSFREDLYYRLNVITIDLPPLRERRDDILLLASYFLDKHGARCKRRLEGISDAARDYLLRYDWPGNVRELENAIERAVVLGSSERIRPEDLPEAVIESAVTAGSSGAKFQEAVLKAKKRAILEAFRQSGGGHGEAARILGIHPIHLHRLIRNLGLKGALKTR